MPGWHSRRATPGARRAWLERPRACAGDSACRPGLCSDEARLNVVAQVRRALGGEQFDQAFADGSELSQQEAVAAARADPTAAVLPAIRCSCRRTSSPQCKSVLVTRNAAGQAQHIVRTTGHAARYCSCPAWWARSSPAPPWPGTADLRWSIGDGISICASFSASSASVPAARSATRCPTPTACPCAPDSGPAAKADAQPPSARKPSTSAANSAWCWNKNPCAESG